VTSAEARAATLGAGGGGAERLLQPSKQRHKATQAPALTLDTSSESRRRDSRYFKLKVTSST